MRHTYRRTPTYRSVRFYSEQSGNSGNFRQPKQYRKYLKPLLALCVIGGVIWFGNVVVNDHAKAPVLNTQKDTQKQAATKPQSLSVDASQSFAAMNDAVNSIIQANPTITFEVAVTDINTGDQVHFGQTGPMTAASVSKILTATDYFKQVELGKRTMQLVLEDGSTASYDMQQMIVVSNDTAWDAFRDNLTYAQLQAYGQALGITNFQSQANTLSAPDTANLLGLLYKGQLLNSSDTALLLSYMKLANYRTYILPAIPSSDTVYHKIGLYEDNVNDATIIANGKQTIALVIFTNGNGTYNWPNRAILMQDIAKPILKYYQLD